MSVDFSIPPVRVRAIFEATVVERTRLSATMLRLTFSSEQFIGLADVMCTDTYVKLILPDPTEPTRDVMRSYTIRACDPSAGTIDIDFALHGRGGVAAVWASNAAVGDRAVFKGMGGGYIPAPHAPWHLMIGDDSALPAIAAALETLNEHADVEIIVVAEDPHELLGEDRRALASVAGSGMRPDVRVVSSTEEVLALIDAAYERNTIPHAFVHGEAGMVRAVRKQLRTVHAMPMSALSISGYWREGATDEQWREAKSAWKQTVLDDERAVSA
ncbi:siderophore-interacting protein [Timonella sp. A28]|uniref:siderophore-interacting protein n=1 Tax=Timonella sp. A28 TaxID=3442640 RepID=UPI003EB8FA83